MYTINITYKTALDEIDINLDKHKAYLDEQYRLGNFIISGRKTPRTGGIILSNLNNKVELERIINSDPFKILNLAHYELIEFVPSKAVDSLHFLLNKN